MTDLQMKSAIKSWLTIIVLIVAVTVATLYDFCFNINWIELLVERSMDIIPVVIGSILQCSYCNFYFKRTALKIVTVTSSIVKRMALHNSFISFVVEKYITTLTIVNLIVKRTFLTSVSEINLVPFISVPIYIVFLKLEAQYITRAIQIARLLLMILIASFNHSNFARELTYLAIVLNSTVCVILSIWNGWYVSIMMSIIVFLF